MVLKYLIEKEFKQMRRNPIIPRLILAFPCMMMILMPWAANLEIKYNNLAVVDLDHSALSRRLVEKVASTDYFNLVENAPDYGRALESVERGEADVILEIPRDFAKSLGTGRPVELQISANSINGTKGGLGSSYLSTVVNDFVNQELGGTGMARLSVLNLYNPHLNYKVFMVPALLIMMLTLLCGFLPALNIVSEKEVGTIEQLNVTPLNKFVFILAKLVPYWIVGLVVLSIGLVLSAVLYGIVPSGSLWLIYFFSCIYILTMSGFGLIISNYSATMQQAMFVMFFFLMVFILMSGLFTPVRSMPDWAQWIAAFNPLTYFIQVMRMIFLKGCGLTDLWPQFGKMLCFMSVFAGVAVWSYRKTNA
ncbi:ABC transporter permease [Paraprevotella clara]|uniref:ABC transporter permease n=1 Tax=Paraprevotella clara TaxID=454154 RepID=UPI004025BA00